MMTLEVIITCNGCYTPFGARRIVQDDERLLVSQHRAELNHVAQAAGWKEIGHDHYCPTCLKKQGAFPPLIEASL